MRDNESVKPVLEALQRVADSGNATDPLTIQYGHATSSMHGHGEDNWLTLDATTRQVTHRGTFRGQLDNAGRDVVSAARVQRLATRMLEARFHEVREVPGPINFGAHLTRFTVTIPSAEIYSCAPRHQLQSDELLLLIATFEELLWICPDEGSGDFELLSQAADTSFECDGQTWRSAEHYIQFQRCAGMDDIETRLRDALSGREAREIGQYASLSTNRRRKWKKRAAEVIRRATESRFQSRPDLRELLLQTGNARLVDLLQMEHGQNVRPQLDDLTAVRARLQHQAG